MPRRFDRDEHAQIRHASQNANLQPVLNQLLVVQQQTQGLANNPDLDVNRAVDLINQAVGLIQQVIQKPGA